MKIQVPSVITEDIKLVRIAAAVNYGEEEIPNDFPGRVGNLWRADVEIATGRIVGWPAGREPADIHLTVKDSGSYSLITEDGREIGLIDGGYVPNEVIPGSYGDTIELTINAKGEIENWDVPSEGDIKEAFFPDRA